MPSGYFFRVCSLSVLTLMAVKASELLGFVAFGKIAHCRDGSLIGARKDDVSYLLSAREEEWSHND